MLVLIDESGDAGFKLDQGSTSHFVIAMVIFEDSKEAEKTSKAIAAALIDLRVKGEFKFAKCPNKVKDAFFQVIKPFKFKVQVLIVEKSRIYSSNLKENKEKFYNYFVKQLIKHDGKTLENANIKIDGSGDRNFKRELEKYLRLHLGPKKVAKIKFSESHRDHLIQLADMVVGAIARAYRRKESNEWFKSLKGKIDKLWEFK